MTGHQFKIAIEKVGLSEESAGVFFGKSAHTGRCWATGEYKVPGYIGHLLRYMVKNGIMAKDVAAGPKAISDLVKTLG